MTHIPPLPPPPFGDDTDEALSALLDGELGAFAAERGLTEQAAQDQLEAWPGYAAAIESLGAVHTAVSEPVAPLDDVTRRRLVRTAVNAVPGEGATPVRTRRSRASIVAAAAAALVVIVGIGFAVSSVGGGGSESKSATSSAGGTTLRGNLGNLGNVTDPSVLRALLDQRGAPNSATQSGSSTNKSADGSFEYNGADRAAKPSAPGAADSTVDRASALAGTPPSTLAPAACAQQVAGSRPVIFTGTGTYSGLPATIAGISSSGRIIVFVVSSTDCSKILASVSR